MTFGDFRLFVLFPSHLCGFIYLWSFKLVTFGWGFGVVILFVDDEVISFCFLVFFLTVRPLCRRTAGGPPQTLLAWGSPVAAAKE